MPLIDELRSPPTSAEPPQRVSDAPSGVPVLASPKVAPPARQPVVRYVGCRSTVRGREYTLRVTDVQSSREFVLIISNQSFATQETRYQDAPDVCSGKLRRELAADPDLLPGDGIAVTSQDLLDYRNSQRSPITKRARAKL